MAQRNDRPAGAIRRTEFGLQVRLPYYIEHLEFEANYLVGSLLIFVLFAVGGVWNSSTHWKKLELSTIL